MCTLKSKASITMGWIFCVTGITSDSLLSQSLQTVADVHDSIQCVFQAVMAESIPLWRWLRNVPILYDFHGSLISIIFQRCPFDCGSIEEWTYLIAVIIEQLHGLLLSYSLKICLTTVTGLTLISLWQQMLTLILFVNNIFFFACLLISNHTVYSWSDFSTWHFFRANFVKGGVRKKTTTDCNTVPLTTEPMVMSVLKNGKRFSFKANRRFSGGSQCQHQHPPSHIKMPPLIMLWS